MTELDKLEDQAFDADPLHSAAAAGLHYTMDDVPGIRRETDGDGVTYIDPHGKRVSDPRTIERIEQLAHPAGVDRRLDLPDAARPSAGDRPRRDAGASSTATTRAGARCATRRSTSG